MTSPIATTIAFVVLIVVVFFGPSYVFRRRRVRDKAVLDKAQTLGDAERSAYLDEWMQRDARRTRRLVRGMDVVTVILLGVAVLLAVIMVLGPMFERQERERAGQDAAAIRSAPTAAATTAAAER